MPDDDLPDLWKKSSLRDRVDPPLQIIIQENYDVKKSKN